MSDYWQTRNVKVSQWSQNLMLLRNLLLPKKSTKTVS